VIEQSHIGVMDPIQSVPPRRSTRRTAFIVASITLAVLALLASLVLAAWFFWIKPGLKDFPFGPRGLDRLVAGSIGASVAASQAQALHTPLGQITLQELQSADTGLRWIPGQVSSPSATGSKNDKWIVSFMASDQHIITAVQSAPGICIFGLYVASASDPVIVSDHLPGPGLFMSFAISDAVRGSGPVKAVSCAAVNAPTTGWVEDPGAPSASGVRNGKYVGS